MAGQKCGNVVAMSFIVRMDIAFPYLTMELKRCERGCGKVL
jgi:hypothetical protein